jgi:flagellar capping protein FliD
MSTGGEFMERAGMPGTPSAEMNRMTRRIENENRRIEEMITNLQRKEARYFQTFGRLEASMMQANSQMMFLEQMFWTG